MVSSTRRIQSVIVNDIYINRGVHEVRVGFGVGRLRLE